MRSEGDMGGRRRHDSPQHAYRGQQLAYAEPPEPPLLPPPPSSPSAVASAPKHFKHRAFVAGFDGERGMLCRDRQTLTRHFSQFGQVVDVFLPKGKPVGFVAFEAALQLQRALDAANHLVAGVALRVTRAEKRPPEDGVNELQLPADARTRGLRIRDEKSKRSLEGDLHDRTSPGLERERDRLDWCPPVHSPRDWGREWDRDRGALGSRTPEAAAINVLQAAHVLQPPHAPHATQPAPFCGVGMTLEPVDPGRGGFCYVANIKRGGAVHQSGRVMVGDELVRIDGFTCVGQTRDEIKRRVLGPQDTEIVLEFKRAGQDAFEVKLRRSHALNVEHPGSASAQALGEEADVAGAQRRRSQPQDCQSNFNPRSHSGKVETQDVSEAKVAQQDAQQDALDSVSEHKRKLNLTGTEAPAVLSASQLPPQIAACDVAAAASNTFNDGIAEKAANGSGAAEASARGGPVLGPAPKRPRHHEASEKGSAKDRDTQVERNCDKDATSGVRAVSGAACTETGSCTAARGIPPPPANWSGTLGMAPQAAAAAESLQRQDSECNEKMRACKTDARNAEAPDAAIVVCKPEPAAAVSAPSGGPLSVVNGSAGEGRPSDSTRERTGLHRDRDEDKCSFGDPAMGSGDSVGSKRPRTHSQRIDSPGAVRDVRKPPEARAPRSLVLATQSEGCAEVEQVVAHASTLSDLVNGLLTQAGQGGVGGAASQGRLWGPDVSAAQVLKVMECVVEIRKGESKEARVVGDEEVHLVDALVKCLGQKCDEMQDISGIFLAVDLLVGLDYFPFPQSVEVERKAAGKTVMAGLVKAVARLAFTLHAEELVKMFATFSRAGRDAGDVLLHPATSYAILRRAQNLWSSMRPDTFILMVESLHMLDSDPPENFADALAVEMKRVLRDTRLKLSPNIKLLCALASMRRLGGARHELLQLLTEKMRGLFKDLTPSMLAESVVLLAVRDVTVQTQVLQEYAWAAEGHANQNNLPPRDAADILWALKNLCWVEARDGKVTAALVQAATRALQAHQADLEANQDDLLLQQFKAISPPDNTPTLSPETKLWSPTCALGAVPGLGTTPAALLDCAGVEPTEGAAAASKDAARKRRDECSEKDTDCFREQTVTSEVPVSASIQDHLAIGIKVGRRDEISAENVLVPAGQCPSHVGAAATDNSDVPGSSRSSHHVTEVHVEDARDSEEAAVLDVSKVAAAVPEEATALASVKGLRQESSVDCGLGAMGTARLLWTLAKIGMLDEARNLYKLVWNTVSLGYSDLQPRELTDFLWAVTYQMNVKLSVSLQKNLCLAALVCIKKLQAGEISVTLTGLMKSGHALPKELLEAGVARIREVRRGLSTTNCFDILKALMDLKTASAGGDETAPMHVDEEEVELLIQWQLEQKLASELIQELSNLAEKLDAKGMAQLMRAVATYGLKLSPEHGLNFSRRAHAIHIGLVAGIGGDRRGGGRGSRHEGFNANQLIDVISGFIASGIWSQDAQGKGGDYACNARQNGCEERLAGLNMVVVLCEDLRGRVSGLPLQLLSDAIVAVAVGGNPLSWNALDVTDASMAKLSLPMESTDGKSAISRRDLLSALLDTLSTKTKEVSGGQLANAVCACALAKQSCGAKEVVVNHRVDHRVDLMLQDAGKKIACVGARVACALLHVLAMCGAVLSKPAFLHIVAHVVDKKKELLSRDLALAVNAIAILNQEAVAENFSTLAHEVLARIHARPLRQWGLRAPDIPNTTSVPSRTVPTNVSAVSEPLDVLKDEIAESNSDLQDTPLTESSSHRKESSEMPATPGPNHVTGVTDTSKPLASSGGDEVSILALGKDETAAIPQLKLLVHTASMILWAEAVMSHYPPARTEFFLKSARPRVRWNDDVKGMDDESGPTVRCTGAEKTKEISSQPPHGIGKSSGEESATRESATRESATSESARACIQGEIASKLFKVWTLWGDHDRALSSQGVGDDRAVGGIMSQRVLVRLHHVFLALQMAGKSIEEEVLGVGAANAGADGVHVQRFEQLCRKGFTEEQQREDVLRNTEYLREICEAAEELNLRLEQGLVDDATGYVIPVGNMQQRVAVEVLLHQDVVEGEDTATPSLRGARSLRRRLLEFNKWNVVQLRLSSWHLVRANNLAKKKFLLSRDRLGSYAQPSSWNQEGAVAGALKDVDGCEALLSFLEILFCTHPKGLQALDAQMVTWCFRKMVLHTSQQNQDRAASVGGASMQIFPALKTLDKADANLKSRVMDVLDVTKLGLQTRALEVLEHMSFSDANGVLVCVAQVWASIGSPRRVLLQPLLAGLCEKLAKDVVPAEMSSTTAEHLAHALHTLSVTSSGQSELPHKALKAAVSAALVRCREASATAAVSSSGGFLASLDPDAASSLATAAALLVPLTSLLSQHATSADAASFASHRAGALFVLEDVWGTEADNWQKQALGPDESVASQVKALGTRLLSLAAGCSLSAKHVVELIRCFGRGTPRDVLLMRSLLARLCEHVAADDAQTKCQREEAEREWHRGYVAADTSAEANEPRLRAACPECPATDLTRAIFELVAACARNGLHIGVMPQALLERLRRPLFLSSLLYDELLSVLLCMAWGTFWDAPLWAALVRLLNEQADTALGSALRHSSFSLRSLSHEQAASASLASASGPGNTGKNAEHDGGEEDQLAEIKRDVTLLWAVAASGTLRSREGAAGLCGVQDASAQAPPPALQHSMQRLQQSCNKLQAAAAAAACARPMAEEEEALCRRALTRIASSWDAELFRIRSAGEPCSAATELQQAAAGFAASSSSTLARLQLPDARERGAGGVGGMQARERGGERELPDAHTDMLRQALQALRFADIDEHKSLPAKPSRRKSSKALADKCGGASCLQRLVDDSLLNSVQLLEKQTHLRGAHLDGLRSLACSHVRHEVASVLPGSMRQEAVIAEGHALPRGHNLPSAAHPSAAAHPRLHAAVAEAHAARPGWLWLQGLQGAGSGSGALVNIYGKLDFLDALHSAESKSRATHSELNAAAPEPRILNGRWMVWEEQMKKLHKVLIARVPVDDWQDCVADAAEEASLDLDVQGGECLAQRPPTRTLYLARVLQQVSACSSACVANALAAVNAAEPETHPSELGTDEQVAHGSVSSFVVALSPSSMAGDSPRDHSPQDDCAMDVDQAEQGSEGGSGAAAAKQRMRGANGHRKRGTDKKKKLWKVEFSKSKQRWYYFNSKSAERVWNPPEVPGWIIKSGSGKHRPYVGLKDYYFNTKTKECSYDPPLERDK